jgi:hypothetical protein
VSIPAWGRPPRTIASYAIDLARRRGRDTAARETLGERAPEPKPKKKRRGRARR